MDVRARIPQQIYAVLNEYIELIRGIYGERLKAMILYGSYARGDFNAGSDVDVMILTSLPREETGNLPDAVMDATYDIILKHDVDIQPMVENESFFHAWESALPYFRNVSKEGVSLYAA